MAQFLILHAGFSKPSPEDMQAWNDWFQSIAERQVDRAHLPTGCEITNSGTEDLPFGPDSLTGFTIIEAESFDEARSIAERCPVVLSTRVYEIRR